MLCFVIEPHHTEEDRQKEQTEHEIWRGAQVLIELVSQPEEKEGCDHHHETPGR